MSEIEPQRRRPATITPVLEDRMVPAPHRSYGRGRRLVDRTIAALDWIDQGVTTVLRAAWIGTLESFAMYAESVYLPGPHMYSSDRQNGSRPTEISGSLEDLIATVRQLETPAEWLLWENTGYSGYTDAAGPAEDLSDEGFPK